MGQVYVNVSYIPFLIFCFCSYTNYSVEETVIGFSFPVDEVDAFVNRKDREQTKASIVCNKTI